MARTLRHMISEVARATLLTDPGELAEEVLRQLPPDRVGEVLTEALRGYVEQVTSEDRRGRRPERFASLRTFGRREPNFDVGKLIEARLNRDWSIAELARRSGSDDGYLSQVERGLRHPSRDKIKTLARALQIPWTDLITMAPEGRPESSHSCEACALGEEAS